MRVTADAARSSAQERRLRQLRWHLAAVDTRTVTVPDRTISLSRTAESSARPVLTAEKLSEVVEWSHGLVDSGELPHGAVLVAHRGSVVLADAYGPSRPLESHDAIRHGTSEDTLFRLYSMTKPIAAALAMVMVDEGRMKLSDPLSKHLPAFASTPATIYGGAGGTVQGEPTVKQLLQHRAGIYCPEFPQLFSWVESNLDDFSDPHTRLQRTVDTIAGEPLVHQPGSDFVYGIQYDVLGRLLEVVGGMPLDELFEVKIFEPLEMKRTTFRQDPTLISSLATVCQPSARGLIDVAEQNTRPGVSTCHPLGYFCAGEGLIATMEDFYRFAGALANGGAPPQGNPGRRFLSEESAHYMTTNQLAGDTATGDMSEFPSRPQKLGFGMGVSVSLAPDEDGVGSAGEYGWGGAAATVYWADPVEDLVVLYFTQVLGARRGPKEDLRRLVYKALRAQ